MTEGDAVRAVLYAHGVEIQDVSLDHSYYRYERKRMITVITFDRWNARSLCELLQTFPQSDEYVGCRVIAWKNYTLTLNEQSYIRSGEIGSWQRREATVPARSDGEVEAL